MFTQLSNWFSQLDSTMQLFWACAIAASVVFIIQNALMLMGLGDMDADVDADVSTDFDVHTDLDADGVGDIDVSTGHTGHEGTRVTRAHWVRQASSPCLPYGTSSTSSWASAGAASVSLPL